MLGIKNVQHHTWPNLKFVCFFFISFWFSRQDLNVAADGLEFDQAGFTLSEVGLPSTGVKSVHHLTQHLLILRKHLSM